MRASRILPALALLALLAACGSADPLAPAERASFDGLGQIGSGNITSTGTDTDSTSTERGPGLMGSGN